MGAFFVADMEKNNCDLRIEIKSTVDRTIALSSVLCVSMEDGRSIEYACSFVMAYTSCNFYAYVVCSF